MDLDLDLRVSQAEFALVASFLEIDRTDAQSIFGDVMRLAGPKAMGAPLPLRAFVKALGVAVDDVSGQRALADAVHKAQSFWAQYGRPDPSAGMGDSDDDSNDDSDSESGGDDSDTLDQEDEQLSVYEKAPMGATQTKAKARPRSSRGGGGRRRQRLSDCVGSKTFPTPEQAER